MTDFLDEPMQVPGQTELDLDDCPPHGIERPTQSAANLWSMTPSQLRDIMDLPIGSDVELDEELREAAHRELLFRALGSAQARKYLK